MDLKKLRKKLQDLETKNQKQKGGNKLIWKPEEGAQVIRIVPYKYDEEWPFVELYFYYMFERKTILSPTSFGKADPIKDFCDTLMQTGEKEDYILAKKLQAKLRIYVPILVRGKEDEGVKYWGFGNQIYTELVKTINDPDYGDITDLETGRDITIEYAPAVSKEAYPTTTIRVKPNKTLTCPNKDVEKAIKNMEDIKSAWEEVEYDDLKTILQKFIDNTPDDEADAVLGEPKKEDSFLDEISSPVDKEQTKVLDKSKVSDEFDDLFDE